MKPIDILIIKPDKINLFPQNIIEEITQNIRILLTTIMGTVPLDRTLGLDIRFIDQPTPRAMMEAQIFILETIQEYEPRVKVTGIGFVTGEVKAMEGKTLLKVQVSILDEYII